MKGITNILHRDNDTVVGVVLSRSLEEVMEKYALAEATPANLSNMESDLTESVYEVAKTFYPESRLGIRVEFTVPMSDLSGHVNDYLEYFSFPPWVAKLLIW